MKLSTPAEDTKCIRHVVRLTVSYYASKRGWIKSICLATLKRLTTQTWVDDCISNEGVDEVLKRILNLEECKDGLYTVEMCNKTYDHEGGFLDGWDYVLAPYTPQP